MGWIGTSRIIRGRADLIIPTFDSLDRNDGVGNGCIEKSIDTR